MKPSVKFLHAIAAAVPVFEIQMVGVGSQYSAIQAGHANGPEHFWHEVASNCKHDLVTREISRTLWLKVPKHCNHCNHHPRENYI